MGFRTDNQRKAMFAKLNGCRGHSYKQLQAAGVHLRPAADTDKDGTPNKVDAATPLFS